MQKEPPFIEVCGLGRRHPTQNSWLLEEIDFRLRLGETWALAGPSGSGKTLLLRALAGLDPLDAGRLLWRGQPVRGRNLPRYRAGVIYLHQRPAFLEASVGEELQRPFRLREHRQRAFPADRVQAWLDAFGRAEGWLKSPCSELSGGERQWVALVRAMQLQPHVLLLDEPTAALDADAAEAVEQIVKRWYEADRTGRAYVWVSHDAQQAQRMCGATLRLRSGRLV